MPLPAQPATLLGRIAGGQLQTAALILALGITLLTSGYISRSEYTQSLKDFRVLVVEANDSLVARLKRYELALDGLAGFFDATGAFVGKDVVGYVHSLDIADNLPGINGIGFIEAVDAGNVDSFERRIAALENRPFAVHPRTNQPEHFVISIIEPLADNAAALGLDIAFEDGRRTAAISARDSGEPRLTPRILLVQDETKTPGFLLLRPYYRTGAPVGTEMQRRAAHVGWTYAPFVGSKLLSELTKASNTLFDYEVFDGARIDRGALIYASNDHSDGHSHHFSIQTQVELYGRQWTIRWSSLPAFEQAEGSYIAQVVAGFGTLMTGLLWLLFANLAQRERTFASEVVSTRSDLEAQKVQNDSVIDNPLIGIAITDDSGNIQRANAAAKELLGGADLDHAALFDLLPDARGLQAGQRARSVLRIKGNPIVLSIKKNSWTTPAGDARSTYFVRDISQEERDAAAVADAERRLNLALKGSGIGVFEIDLATGRSVVSDTWFKIMGLSAPDRELDAQALFEEHIDADDFVMLQAHDQACIEGRSDRSETNFRMHLPTGTRWIRSVAFVGRRAEDGRAETLVGTMTDITAAMELDRAKNEFVATVNHELRTPLTSIKGAIGLLQKAAQEHLPESAQRLLRIADTNVDRLTRLVNDILDFERVQAGKAPLELETIAIDAFLSEAAEQIAPVAMRKKQDIVVQRVDPQLTFSLDHSRTMQIIVNFLSNACTHAPEASRILLGAELHDTRLRFFVRDHGSGVPAGFETKMFQPFSQADSSDTRSKGGAGLGLSIARELVERMGGEIGYRRTDGGATEFWAEIVDPQAASFHKRPMRKLDKAEFR